MCRILVGDTDLVPYINLKPALKQLETSMGGDGNGAFVPGIGRIRGATVSVDMIAGFLSEASKLIKHSVFAFHTRAASSGGVLSSLNHPFYVDRDGDAVLLHNGTVPAKNLEKFVNDTIPERHHTVIRMSDTAAVAEAVKVHGPAVLGHNALAGTGVWVITGKSKEHGYSYIIYRETGSFGLVPYASLSGKYVFASENIGVLTGSGLKVDNSINSKGRFVMYTVTQDGRPQIATTDSGAMINALVGRTERNGTSRCSSQAPGWRL